MGGPVPPPEAELCRATRQVMEKEGPQPAESEESSIYSPAIPREKWQRKRTQVKIRVCTPVASCCFWGCSCWEPDPMPGQAWDRAQVAGQIPVPAVTQLGRFAAACCEGATLVPQPGGGCVPARGLSGAVLSPACPCRM